MRITKIITILFISIIFIQVQAAANYTSKEAAQILVPYEDDYMLTRLDCLKAINRMIGITDNMVMDYVNDYWIDYQPKRDIEYNTYLGRFIDLGVNLYDRVLYSRSQYYFYGDEPATVGDVLLWVGVISPKGFADKEEIYKFVVENGIIGSELATRTDDYITVPQFKEILENSLNNTVGYYFDENERGQYNIYEYLYNSNNSDYLNLNIFNRSYRDKFIFIRNDGIYLGEEKIDNESIVPFFEERLGIMLMPVRWFAKIYGFGGIEWDSDTQTVVLTNDRKDSVSFTVGDDTCHFIDKRFGDFSFDYPAQNIDNRVYIPLRAVCEGFAYDVIWDIN